MLVCVSVGELAYVLACVSGGEVFDMLVCSGGEVSDMLVFVAFFDSVQRRDENFILE